MNMFPIAHIIAALSLSGIMRNWSKAKVCIQKSVPVSQKGENELNR